MSSHKLLYLLASAVLFSAASVPSACRAQTQSLPLEAAVPLPPAPNLGISTISSLPAIKLSGQKIDLAAQPGWKVIYFWSGACPCVKACERYSFLPLARKYQGRVSFFAVAAGKFDLDQPYDHLAKTVSSHSLPFAVVLDPHHQIAEMLGAKVTPETYLLDPQNRVVFTGMPDDSRRYFGDPKQGVSQTYLARALSQALAGKPVTQPSTDDAGCIIAW